jgi:gluconolactonase
MHKIFILFIAALLVAACTNKAGNTQSASASNTKQKVTGLKTPESAIQTKNGRIFVSEIGASGKDGDGQISEIDSAGKASVFASGLNDPKGLAVIGEYLFVTDKTNILKISLKDAKASIFVAAAAFPSTPQFLNDLEADLQGNLYVSDSGDIRGTGKGGALYKIDATGKVTLLIDGKQDPRVMAPNGLLADDTGDVLLFVDFTSGVLYTFNQKTRVLTDIAEGFGGADGLVHHSDGTMYVSDKKAGKVYSLSTKGDMRVLKEGYQSAADIAISKDEAYLMVPDMNAGELDFIAIK